MLNKCLIVFLCIAGLALASQSNNKEATTSTEPTVSITENVSPRTRSAPRSAKAAPPQKAYYTVNPYTSVRQYSAPVSAYSVPVAYSGARSEYSNGPFYVQGYSNFPIPGYLNGPGSYDTAVASSHPSNSGVQYFAVPYATAAPATAYSTAAPFAAYSTRSPNAAYSTQSQGTEFSTPSPIGAYSTQSPDAAYSTPVQYGAYPTASPFAAYSISGLVAYSIPAPQTYVVSSTSAPPTAGTQSRGPLITTYSSSPVVARPAAQAISYKSVKTYKNPLAQSESNTNVNVVSTSSPVAYSTAAVTPAPGAKTYQTLLRPVAAYALGDGHGNAVSHQSFRQEIESPSYFPVASKSAGPTYSAAPVAYYPDPSPNAGAPGLVNPYQIVPVQVAYTGSAVPQASYPFGPRVHFVSVASNGIQYPVGFAVSPPTVAGTSSVPYGPIAYPAHPTQLARAGAFAAASAVSSVRYNDPYTRYSFK